MPNMLDSVFGRDSGIRCNILNVLNFYLSCLLDQKMFEQVCKMSYSEWVFSCKFAACFQDTFF